MTRHRRIGTLAALALLGASPVSAGAVDGALYPYGSSVWAVGPQMSANVLPGPVWQLQSPALAAAAVGNHWEMNWGCPVPGSQIHSVRFGALRTAAASSLAVQVTGDRRTLWSEGDVGMAQSPAGGRPYDIPLPGGQCNVHLALTQIQARAQHARTYFIDNPRILVRDIAAPGVSLRAVTGGWINAASNRARVEWTANDNFGSDGMGLHRIALAGQTRWSGAPGAGDHAVEFGLDGVGDGVHGVEVIVEGDGTAAGRAGGTLHIDRTPAAAADLTAVPPGAPGAIAVGWRVSDNLSGAAASHVEVNTAPDGSSSGAWETIARAEGPGPHGASVAQIGVADGVHAWRVVAADAAGNAGVTAAPQRMVVDTTPPKLELHSVSANWVTRAELDLTATDNLQGPLGLGTTEIDVNAAADGGEGGEWLRRSAAMAAPGRRLAAVDLAGVADGRHQLRVLVRNGGPFGSALVTERRAVIRVDRTSPEISRVAFAAGGGPMAVSWLADDAAAGVASVTVQWRDGATWRTLASRTASDGAGSMEVDVSSVPAGVRALRLVVADGAGNSAVRMGSARLLGGGAGSSASDPFARLRDARLTVALAGARVQRRGVRRVLVRRIGVGTALAITGRLQDRAGRGIVGAEVRAHGHRGALVGRALSDQGGDFLLVARPLAGGTLRVGVPAGGRLLPARASADIRVEVRPRVSLAASTTMAWPGTQVLFSGRLHPAPVLIGLSARKGVVLEWRDPVRRAWRPVVNARIRRDGTFAIPWSFNLRGLRIPMRATVPAEVGWPLLPVRSRVITMAVGQ